MECLPTLTFRKILVYFYGREESNFTGPDQGLLIKDTPGLVTTEYSLVGQVLACIFTDSEDQEKGSELLRISLEKQEVNRCCYISAQLSCENSVCVLSVAGMTCQSCVQLIESTVGQLPGVRAIKVSLQRNEAFVEHDPHLVQTNKLSSAIYDMGFDASVTTTYNALPPPPAQLPLPLPPILQTSGVAVIEIEGMTCSSCTQNIESNLSKTKGVNSIKVSLQDKSAAVDFDPTLTSPQELADAIYELGFEAKVRSWGSSSHITESGIGEVRMCYVKIDGMTCHSCESLIELLVGGLEGVMKVKISFSGKEGVVEFNSALTSVAAICEIINSNKKFHVTYVTGELFSVY